MFQILVFIIIIIWFDLDGQFRILDFYKVKFSPLTAINLKSLQTIYPRSPSLRCFLSYKNSSIQNISSNFSYSQYRKEKKMKIVFGIFSAAMAAPFNSCPGTCWTENNGVCTPDLNEVRLLEDIFQPNFNNYF